MFRIEDRRSGVIPATLLAALLGVAGLPAWAKIAEENELVNPAFVEIVTKLIAASETGSSSAGVISPRTAALAVETVLSKLDQMSKVLHDPKLAESIWYSPLKPEGWIRNEWFP